MSLWVLNTAAQWRWSPCEHICQAWAIPSSFNIKVEMPIFMRASSSFPYAVSTEAWRWSSLPVTLLLPPCLTLFDCDGYVLTKQSLRPPPPVSVPLFIFLFCPFKRPLHTAFLHTHTHLPPALTFSRALRHPALQAAPPSFTFYRSAVNTGWLFFNRRSWMAVAKFYNNNK